MTRKQHYKSLQYLHRTLAIGAVTSLMSTYDRVNTTPPWDTVSGLPGYHIGLLFYCFLLVSIRTKFYLDDESHFEHLVQEGDHNTPELHEKLNMFFAVVSWLAFLFASALLRTAKYSRDCVIVAMVSSLAWIFYASLRDGSFRARRGLYAATNILYIVILLALNHLQPEWGVLHGSDATMRHLLYLAGFVVCGLDFAVTYQI